MYSHRMNSPRNLVQYSGNTSSKIFSCIRASANTGPACIRAKINSPRFFSCMYWFCAGGYVGGGGVRGVLGGVYRRSMLPSPL